MYLKKIVTAMLLLFSLLTYAQSDTAFVYHKPLFDFDYSKPVFDFKQVTNTNLYLRYTALTGYREGVKPNSIQLVNYNKELKTNQFYWNNLSVKELLMINLLVTPGRFLFEVKDPSVYDYQIAYGDKRSWLRKNGYCFEYMLPSGINLNAEEKQKIVEGILDLECNWEMHKVKCYAIVRTSTINKLKSEGKPISSVATYLEYMSGLDGTIYGSPLPVINETGFGEGAGLEGSFVWSDLATVRKQLQEYDLDIIEKVIETRMYVVKEINQ